ncbi:MAG: prolyl oligopeptidase family serine peptidase, partial [Planctomycetes bacterium]|nr:prolyl oligopeptidase family serine peptidase [Planctomycetota bacterium]
MSYLRICPWLCGLILLSAVNAGCQSDGRPAYPTTRVIDVVETIHGVPVHDPYRWLEGDGEPAVQAWTQAQNALTRRYLERFAEQRAALVNQLQGLYAAGSASSPQIRGQRYFYTQRSGSQNHAVVYVKQNSISATPRVALDPNAFSPDGTVALDWWYPSPDGSLIAYGKSPDGSERSTLHIRNVDTGKDGPLAIPYTRGSTVAWDQDGRGFLYLRYPEPGTVPPGDENYHRHVYYHRLGTDSRDDPRLFGEGRPKEEWPDVNNSSDLRYQFLSAGLGWSRNDLHFRLAGNGGFRPVAVGYDAIFRGDALGDKLYLLTNYRAPRYRLLVTDAHKPVERNWREVVPEGTGTIDSFVIVAGKLVLHVMEDASSRLRVYETDGTFVTEIELPTLGTVRGLQGSFDRSELFFEFESLVYPPTVFRYDLESGERRVVAQPEIDFPFDRYETKQVWFHSRDGTRVPMFVVHKTGLVLDGNNPTILSGYGGFNISYTPYFQVHRLPWLERGGVYALANLRGGGEFGEAWHRAGRRDLKQNCFDDFFAAAEKLIADRYTSPERLAIRGGSNGGLLVG